jgi:hypothetical protein
MKILLQWALLVLVIIPLGLLILMVGLIALNLYVIGPWRHEVNTKAAEVTNDDIWGNTSAEIYTIEVKYRLDGKEGSASTELICARKVRTENISFKGGPYVHDIVWNVGKRTFLFPVSDDYTAEIALPRQCERIVAYYQQEEIPLQYEDYYGRIVVIRRLLQPSDACNQVMRENSIWFGSLQLFRPHIVSVRREALKNILSRADFGPADKSEQRALWQSSGTSPGFRDSTDKGVRGADCWGP